MFWVPFAGKKHQTSLNRTINQLGKSVRHLCERRWADAMGFRNAEKVHGKGIVWDNTVCFVRFWIIRSKLNGFGQANCWNCIHATNDTFEHRTVCARWLNCLSTGQTQLRWLIAQLQRTQTHSHRLTQRHRYKTDHRQSYHSTTPVFTNVAPFNTKSSNINYEIIQIKSRISWRKC